MLVSSKGSAFVHATAAIATRPRSYSSPVAGPVPAPNGKATSRADDPAGQRELFVSVLHANATRRDAKQYLSRFKPAPRPQSGPKPDVYALWAERNAQNRRDQRRLDSVGVNLGALYAPARAIADAPQFTNHGDSVLEQRPQQLQKQQHHHQQQQQQLFQHSAPAEEPLHVALACLKSPETIDDTTIDGLARTLSQLVQLDMRIILVLDPGSSVIPRAGNISALRKLLAEQANRLCDAIDRHNPDGGRPVSTALEVADEDADVHVTLPSLILEPLKRSIIAVLPSLAYTTTGQLVSVSVADVMTGLTKYLTGQDPPPRYSGERLAQEAVLDRVILIDPIGGIPSRDRGDGAHVFINLEQEFDTVAGELAEYAADAMERDESFFQHAVYEQHQANLDTIRKCLEILPSSSSALIVTPQEAASSSQASQSKLPALGAGTRRQRNPLIHNLLTNRPLISSSLPRARFSHPDSDGSEPPSAATVLRRGMPLKMVPVPPRLQGLLRPKNGISPLDLRKDPRINLRRLVHLIEDSFRRKLHVDNYLNRIQNRIAGIIVAGDYEGAAILTWEMPPGVNDPSRLVPYLDKFAVLQSSQGSSGVADIVFLAMVRSCFPRGVCWRSRSENPVNKWYFERSTATWKIPNSGWTMFWTGEDIVDHEQKWSDYVGVCSSIQPSWDDMKPD